MRELRKHIAIMLAVLFTTNAHAAAIITFSWSGYSNGDHLNSDWSVLGTGTEATINPNTDWTGSPKALNQNPAAWFAAIYNVTTYSSSTYLGIYSRSGYDRATFVWDRSVNACYIWQYQPQSGASTLGKDWVAGVGITTVLDTQTYVPANNKDFIRSVVHAGSSIKCYVNGVLVHTITDSSYTSGSVGVQDFAASTWSGDITLFDGPTNTPTLTSTPTPVATNTFTYSPTLTNTPSPTLTPSPTPTATPTPVIQRKMLLNLKRSLTD